MAAFQFQYTNLIMMIFKQLVILSLIVMAFQFEPDSTRTSFFPTILMPTTITPAK
jgi:hypothetical protein